MAKFVVFWTDTCDECDMVKTICLERDTKEQIIALIGKEDFNYKNKLNKFFSDQRIWSEKLEKEVKVVGKLGSVSNTYDAKELSIWHKTNPNPKPPIANELCIKDTDYKILTLEEWFLQNKISEC